MDSHELAVWTLLPAVVVYRHVCWLSKLPLLVCHLVDATVNNRCALTLSQTVVVREDGWSDLKALLYTCQETYSDKCGADWQGQVYQ